jgi:hypothetical protein
MTSLLSQKLSKAREIKHALDTEEIPYYQSFINQMSESEVTAFRKACTRCNNAVNKGASIGQCSDYLQSAVNAIIARR